MTRFIHVLIILTLFTGMFFSLHAQYDERNILMQRARRLDMRRNTEESENIYRQILQKFPGDTEATERLIQNLMLDQKIEQARLVLEEQKPHLSDNDYVQIRLQILLKEGDREEARKMVAEVIGQNTGNVNLYLQYARIYERYQFFEEAIELYERAVEITGNATQFANYLAQTYFRQGDYEKAIPMFLIYLLDNRSYRHASQYYIKRILEEDPQQIATIESFEKEHPDPLIREVLAASYVQIERFDEAFTLYADLDVQQLANLAEEQQAAMKPRIALRAWQHYIERETDTFRLADARIQMTHILIALNRPEEAREILMVVYNNQELRERRNLYRTRANQQACQLLARIGLMLDAPEDEVVEYFEEAQRFAFNPDEKRQIAMQHVHYLTMSGAWDQAQQKLDGLLQGVAEGSTTQTMGMHQSLLLALMQNQTRADTLLNELVIRDPENPMLNDALFLGVTAGGLSDSLRNGFLQAYRLQQLYRTAQAVDRMRRIAQSSGNELFWLIGGQWAMDAGDTDTAQLMLDRDFTDSTTRGYAAWLLTRAENNEANRYRMITEFLSQNPANVFAPAFRMMLQEEPSS